MQHDPGNDDFCRTFVRFIEIFRNLFWRTNIVCRVLVTDNVYSHSEHHISRRFYQFRGRPGHYRLYSYHIYVLWRLGWLFYCSDPTKQPSKVTERIKIASGEK